MSLSEFGRRAAGRRPTQPHSQGSGHLLEVVGAAGIKDGAALEQLQGLLDFALETQDQRCAASDDFYMRESEGDVRNQRRSSSGRSGQPAGLFTAGGG